jgi:hypothetical protein
MNQPCSDIGEEVIVKRIYEGRQCRSRGVRKPRKVLLQNVKQGFSNDS